MTTRPSADQVRLLTRPGEPWLSCDECFQLMDVVVDRVASEKEASLGDLPRLRAHLGACPACAEEVDSLLELVCADSGVDGGPARRALGLDEVRKG